MNLELILKYREYFEAVAQAHTECAKRSNMSSQVLRAMHEAGAEDMRSIMTAMTTLETLHGPVKRARTQMMDGSWHQARGVIIPGTLIYGFGSSFIKGKPDPLLDDCDAAMLNTLMEPGTGRIKSPVRIKSASGKPLYPNMAYYTAILCELIEWPDGFEFLLVCMFRAGEWRKILNA